MWFQIFFAFGSHYLFLNVKEINKKIDSIQFWIFLPELKIN